MEVQGSNEKNNAAPAGKSQFSPPAVTLPKGGGAIRGIGEKFSANPVTGTGSMSVPIATSPGRSGFGPQLSLSYDSGSGNGSFGFGWSLSLPAITRKTDKGLPKYFDAEESDEFILSGAEDLVPILVKYNGTWEREKLPSRTVENKTYDIQRYRPRIEGLFACIERWTNQTNPQDTCWRSISKDNVTTWYGRTEDSRIFDPTNPIHIFSWLICQSYDDKGNAIIYEYVPENSEGIDGSKANEQNRMPDTRKVNLYLKYIKYGNLEPNRDANWQATDPSLLNDEKWMFKVVFDYDEIHCEKLPLDNSLPVNAQHSYILASDIPGRTWAVRPDPFSAYRGGFEVRTYRRCHRVLMLHQFKELGDDPCLVRSTEFEYADFDYSKQYTVKDEVEHKGSTRLASFIQSVTQSGYVRDATKKVVKHNGVKYQTYIKKSLPPLEFDYTRASINEQIQEIDAASLVNMPNGLDGSRYQWVDLDGEGISGILTEQADAWFYKSNTGEGEFGPLERVAFKPSLAALGSGQQQLLDLAGDGQLDLVEFGGSVPGFYERTQDQNWEQFKPFVSLPNLEWSDANLKFVDLTGDGHADILITSEEAFIWYPSLAEDGFGRAEMIRQALNEEEGPRLLFADGTQSIYLSDFSGDGLTDFVRIRNGEICYWPNLGYGRFGAKVTMDKAPWFDAPDMFDQKHIRLADIDGSGTTDIIYLHHNRAAIYRNKCGNSWSDTDYINSFPQVDNLSTVIAVDLLGTGTACLVWSSPLPGASQAPMKYIDLMRQGKPHLLTKTVNNLGTETQVHYAPSTRFYLEDKKNGVPWITRLSFPVHVVERVETYDHISRNRFVARYAYHHGYFDGEEREFRGFGMVEQWDTEEFATFEKDGLLKDSNNLDAASHVPPIHTKTWFHTGAYIEGEKISRQFEKEYFCEPGLYPEEAEKLLLDDTILPDNMSPDEEQEACRSLKGSMLRQEVYADDAPAGSPDAMIQRARMPYTVTEQNFTIRRLQPKGNNKHGVFFTHPREAISYHYERNPSDPRVGHTLTLETDDFGNVLKSLSIGYGRRPGLSPLEGDDIKKQEQTLMTYIENDVTDVIDYPAFSDDYRTPLPSEARIYEVTGFILSANTVRFQFKEFTVNNFQPLLSLTKIEYEDPTDYTKKQKRLIERVRTLYRKDDLTGFLQSGKIEPLALPGETYKLAFTPGLLNKIYIRNSTKLLPADPANVLEGSGADRGGYVNLDSDGCWWIPSGRVFYHLDANINNPPVTTAQELIQGRQNFFVPRKYSDPFGNCTKVYYDPYNLVIIKTQDALLNIVEAITDYRVLQPKEVIDPNDNHTEAAFDALGLVAATAVMGKNNESGDSVKNVIIDLTESQLSDFFTQPKAKALQYLDKATTRIIYDIDCFSRTYKAYPDDQTKWRPPYAAILARELHVAMPGGDKPPVQVSFSYSDGFGREIQKKIQAEPETPGGALRWVGSGWTIFNNKGKPVRQYEPFFSTLPVNPHQFEFSRIEGVSPVLFYDPIERVIATMHPNHAYEKVVFDPCQQKTYDVNDTVAMDDTETGDPRIDPDIKGYVSEYFKEQAGDWKTWYEERITGAKGPEEKSAAQKAGKHANTPTTAHFDSLGRIFLTIAHNRYDITNTDGSVTTKNEKYETCVELDIEGNQRWVTDSKGRIIMKYDYYMAGPDKDAENKSTNLIHQSSMEAGERWILNDVTGKPIRNWDSRGFIRRTTYDELRRPRSLYVTENGMERLAEETVYGENQGNANNHRTRVYQVYDGAGIVTNEIYDFKGNLKKSKRDLLKEYDKVADWLQKPKPFDGTYSTSTEYDALNRPLAVTSPDASVYIPAFNEANLLEKVNVKLRGAAESTPFVTNINYNAKGQRELIDYGNGTHTFYEYDKFTFRLTRLMTTRPDKPDAVTSQIFKQASLVQDLHYFYDPAGNITQIEDSALKAVYYDGQQINPVCNYTYDAIYRLIQAEGREHIGQTAHDFNPQNYNRRDYDFAGLSDFIIHPNDMQALRNYMEYFDYDPAGNFNSIRHRAANGNWTRAYEYNENSLIEPAKKSNRLSKTTIGNGYNHIETYTYKDAQGIDVHGCMTSINGMKMQWDFEDQLQQIDLGGGGTAYYVYDASGQRARKIIVSQNGQKQKDRIYLGGYEIYREYNGNASPKLERESLHIVDDKQRILLIETKTMENSNPINNPVPVHRYQFGNHLGSACLELAEDSSLISYEEYHPYGTSSFQAGTSAAEISLKRYRYTGKERDEESGLYYYGARYYAAWIGRWTSCDPIGIKDGVNVYEHVRGNPVVFIDNNGLASDDVINQVSDKYVPVSRNHGSAKIIDLPSFPGALSDYDFGPAPDPSKATWVTQDKRFGWGYFKGMDSSNKNEVNNPKIVLEAIPTSANPPMLQQSTISFPLHKKTPAAKKPVKQDKAKMPEMLPKESPKEPTKVDYTSGPLSKETLNLIKVVTPSKFDKIFKGICTGIKGVSIFIPPLKLFGQACDTVERMAELGEANKSGNKIQAAHAIAVALVVCALLLKDKEVSLTEEGKKLLKGQEEGISDVCSSMPTEVIDDIANRRPNEAATLLCENLIDQLFSNIKVGPKDLGPGGNKKMFLSTCSKYPRAFK